MAYSVAAQSITAATAAALIAGLAVFLTSAVPEAKAEQLKAPLEQSLGKGDRLPLLAKGSACSTRAWPHYEQNCQFDLRRSADDLRKVRVVGLTRS
jgi:hypothetical protein